MSVRMLAIIALTIAVLTSRTGYPQQEKKEITVTGKVVCASCNLKLVEKCAVGIDAGDEKYILTKNELSQKLFPKRYDGLTALVTGTVEIKGKGKLARKYLTPTKIEIAEQPKE